MTDKSRRTFFRNMVAGTVGGAATLIGPVARNGGPATVVQACLAFDYGRMLDIEVGEVFALTGQLNDDSLVRTGLVKVVPVDTALHRCTCGRTFVRWKDFADHHARPDRCCRAISV